jgi:GTPase SAR1 family protein
MLVGLSGKKGSGKTTLANHLIHKHRFIELSWATPLKEHVGKGLFGFTDEQVYGDKKEVIDPFWNCTPRYVLQLVGTEFFRERFDSDFWVKLGIRQMNKLQDRGFENIIFPDCRFPNEAKAIEVAGGMMIRVVKAGDVVEDTHASETSLDNFDFDATIVAAAGDLQGLYESAEYFLELA